MGEVKATNFFVPELLMCHFQIAGHHRGGVQNTGSRGWTGKKGGGVSGKQKWSTFFCLCVTWVPGKGKATGASS